MVEAAAKIIVKARAGSLQPLDPAELLTAANAWAEVLQGEVPVVELNACYLHARRTRNSTFPLDVSELCAAWRAIQETRRATPPRPACGICGGTGFGVRYDKATNQDLRESCPYCTKPSSAMVTT